MFLFLNKFGTTATNMKTLLLLSAILLMQILGSSAECRVLQVQRGVKEYGCDSVLDLEGDIDSEMQDLSVFNDKAVPVIRSSTFPKTPHLRRLAIKNAISDIDPGALRPLKELNYLIINNKELRQVKTGIFESLPVEWLDLSYSSVIYIEPGAFSNLTNLKKLYLRRNRLGRVLRGIFNDLSVDTLGLSQNEISTIERRAFENMPNLKRLHLDGNRLSNFEAENVLNYGPRLEILWLHNNSFTVINRKTLRSLDNLKLLNLQDNQISRIGPYTFENVVNLEVLVLSNNSLNRLDPDVFPEGGMPVLSKVYLNDNRFSYLSTIVLERLAYLKAIRIGGNPWQCPCLDTISIWISEHSVKLNCDKDYYSGRRPICVLVEDHPSSCVHETNAESYQKYNEMDSKYPKNVPCFLIN